MPVVLLPLHFDRDPLLRAAFPSCQRSVCIRTFITSDFMTGIPATPGKHLPLEASVCLPLPCLFVWSTSMFVWCFHVCLVHFHVCLVFPCLFGPLPCLFGSTSIFVWCLFVWCLFGPLPCLFVILPPPPLPPLFFFTSMFVFPPVTFMFVCRSCMRWWRHWEVCLESLEYCMI